MSDLIDRQALLKQIDIDSDGEPGYYGDTWKFIDTIKSMPPAELSTNLAEVDTDLANKRVIDVEGLDEQIRCKMCVNPMHTDRGCDGNCRYNENLYKRIIQMLDERIKPLPSAQPETNCSEFPNNSDAISRQAAIDAIRDMQAFEDDNGQPYLYLYDVMAVFTDEEELPSIQPERKECEEREQGECPWYAG